MTKLISINPVNIDQALVDEAVRVISKGGIVALPTETVYGLSARYDMEKSVNKLYEIKKRPKNKPFSLAVASIEKAIKSYFEIMPPFAYRLIEKFWPGPLTIIYYGTSGKKVGIRIPSHKVAEEILRKVDMPVYLPSANISGEKDAVCASEVEAAFRGKIDLIVDAGACSHGSPSTILDLTCKPFKALREGFISNGDIAKVFIKKRIVFVCTGNSCRSPMAQFLLAKYLKEVRPFYDERYEVISAGISAFSGSGAASSVTHILEESEGLDLSSFSAQRLDSRMILSSDLIFTMEDFQKDYILNSVPQSEGRVFNLKKFLPAEQERDIPDPIGTGPDNYRKVYSLIKEAILELRDWI